MIDVARLVSELIAVDGARGHQVQVTVGMLGLEETYESVDEFDEHSMTTASDRRTPL